MSAEHVEIWVQPPVLPVQHMEALEHHQPPAHSQDKIAPDDMLLMGMMLWMEEGLFLDWMRPAPEKRDEEQKPKVKNLDDRKDT